LRFCNVAFNGLLSGLCEKSLQEVHRILLPIYIALRATLMKRLNGCKKLMQIMKWNALAESGTAV